MKLDPSSNELKRHGTDLQKLATALTAATKAFSGGTTKKTIDGLTKAIDDVTDELQAVQKNMTDLDKSLQEYEKAFGKQEKEAKDIDKEIKAIEALKDVEQVLKSDYAAAFRDQCKKEFSTENLEFVEALEKRATPLSIYKDFVANNAINISGPERKKLVDKYGPILDGNPSKDRPNLADFDDAKVNVLKLLNRDTLNRFKNIEIEKLNKQKGKN